MSSVSDLVQKYQRHLVIINYATRTLEGYHQYLGRFKAWLEARGITEIAAVTRDVVSDYQAHLYEEINRKGEPNSVGTQNYALGIVKCFFRFLRESDYLPSDPSRDVSYARRPKRLPRSILTGPEAKKVIHAPNTRTALGYRDRTILEVLYSTGIRRSELMNLELTDVDYTQGFVRVNSGKGNKDRVVPIGKIACRYLENYIKAVRPELVRNPHDTTLFLSLQGRKLSDTTVGDVVKKHTKKTRIKKTITPHTFRHTCATLMLRNKANIRHIQELLGHATLNTTQIYAQVSISDLKEVHSKCHPREKDRE